MDFKRHYYDYQYVINSHDSLDSYLKNIIANLHGQSCRFILFNALYSLIY